MRFIWQPQPQVVFSGSWRISRRGRFAGSAWRLGCLLVVAGLVAAALLLDLGGQGGQIGVDGFFQQALLLGVEAPR